LDESQINRIHSAVRWNKPRNEVAAIIKQVGADLPAAVGSSDLKTGNRCLHIAAQNGHEDLVKWLIEEKADVNAQNFKGQTALHMTVEYDFYFISVLLLDAGADRQLKNEDGHPAIKGIDGGKADADAWDNPVTILKAVPEDDASKLEMAFKKLEEADPSIIDKAALVQAGMQKRRSCSANWNAARFMNIVKNF